MEAGKRNINDIFNGNRVLEIPFFQRAYVWSEDQWERFLADMENVSIANKPYFLGSVILKQQTTNSERNVGDVRTVIDGQQRLTTLNIFFKVLCLKTNKNPSFDRVFKLIDNNIALLHNHNDVSAFNEILDLTEEKILEERGGIKKAYECFRKNMDPEKLSFQKILTNVMFVGIDLGVDEDEQQIFDTINSLGVKLTTAELLKNYFFGRDDLDSYEENWKSIFENDEETKGFWDREVTAGRFRRSNIDLFFYSFLQIKIQDNDLKVKTEDKKDFTKVDGLFDSYKEFITAYDIDKTSLIREIKKYANLYRQEIDFDVVERELTQDFGIDRINAIIFGLDNTTLIPYVLYVLREVPDEIQRQTLFGYLEAYLMRRMVCHETTKNYSRLFSESLIANKVLSVGELKAYINERSDKVNFMPGNEDLKNGFHHSRLVNKQSAGILYMLESKIRDRSRFSTSLLGMRHYSLEHVMPKKWENNWGRLQNEEAKINRNKKLLTLGNLAIITSTLNKSIRDANWSTKKRGRGEKKGLKHFASGIETFADFLSESTWNEEVIDKRAEFLWERAVDIWPN